MAHASPWMMAAALLVACASDDDGSGPSVGGNARCAEDEYALEGTLAGEVISQRGVLRNHTWVQSGSRNTLDTDFENRGRVHTQWDQLIRDGASTAVTGSITMPPGATRAGAVVNAASGAMSKQGDEVRFELTSLSESVECFAPPCPPVAIEGAISGCIHWAHIGP